MTPGIWHQLWFVFGPIGFRTLASFVFSVLTLGNIVTLSCRSCCCCCCCWCCCCCCCCPPKRRCWSSSCISPTDWLPGHHHHDKDKFPHFDYDVHQSEEGGVEIEIRIWAAWPWHRLGDTQTPFSLWVSDKIIPIIVIIIIMFRLTLTLTIISENIRFQRESRLHVHVQLKTFLFWKMWRFLIGFLWPPSLRLVSCSNEISVLWDFIHTSWFRLKPLTEIMLTSRLFNKTVQCLK